MKTLTGTEYVYSQGQDAYTFINPGLEYLIYLIGEPEGSLFVKLPEDSYIVEFYDPKVGQWIGTNSCTGSENTEIIVPLYYDELVVFIQQKTKREKITGATIPLTAE